MPDVTDAQGRFEEAEDPVGLGQTFLAGLDPTGSYTFHLAQRAKRDAGHQATGLIGGLLGGLAIVPSTVGAGVNVARNLGWANQGRGWKGKLSRIGALVTEGAVSPYSAIMHGLRAKRILGDAVKTGRKLSKTETKAVTHALGGMGVDRGDASKMFNPLLMRVAGSKRRAAAYERLIDPITTNLFQSMAALGASAGIGGGSAVLQYNQGRGIGDRLRAADVEV